MNQPPSMAEARCRKQANQLFNNTIETLALKLTEESKELTDELTATVINKEKVLEELGDLIYIINQTAEKFGVTNDECLNQTFAKLNKRHENK
jgi:NTP pyrophosphatase (non-canonical NTP hydrolase)